MAKLIHFLLPLLFMVLTSVRGDYNILSFGAKGNGVSDSTKPFLSAWAAACSSHGSATIYVPPGSYLLSQASFAGPCRSSQITFRIDGTLVAPDGYGSNSHWILFHDVQGVSILGGTIDGRGAHLYSCKASGGNCPHGATSLQFNNAKNIAISGLTSVDSQLFHIVIDGCTNAMVQGVRVMAPGNSPNTDGIHVQHSTGVTITGSTIRTGDDCISVGPGTMNLWVEGIACGPGHGISIGSLGKELHEAGVQNVTVKSVSFSGTENGLRIKTWGRPSSGFVRGITFEHAVMQHVQNPIIIDQNYCPHNNGCPNQYSGISVSDVTYNDIQGSSATQVAVKFDCSYSHPCSRIDLQDVKLMYNNGPAQSSCKNADGSSGGFMVPPSCLR
ncbi:hypothetical protein ACLOJK_008883 [Asimina triloba]